jgi:hypothetical protein
MEGEGTECFVQWGLICPKLHRSFFVSVELLWQSFWEISRAGTCALTWEEPEHELDYERKSSASRIEVSGNSEGTEPCR